MNFDNRIITVWKLCKDYNSALLSVQFHMPGMQIKGVEGETEIPLFIAAAIKKLLSGHWLYIKHMIEIQTVVTEYLSVAKGVHWDRGMSVKVLKMLKIYNFLQQYL